VADTDQAAAGAEAAEPDGLGARRSLLSSARHLLAYLPPLPEALRDLPRRLRADLSGHAADYLIGAGSGLVVAVCGWLLAVSLTLALWAAAAPAGADPWIPVRVGGQLWLASHHVLMHSPDGPFGLSPLGFTLLPLLGQFLAGRWIARRRPGYVPRATFGAVAGYAVAACAVAAGSADSGLRAEYPQVLFYPAVLALIGHGAGAADGIRDLVPGAAVRLWPRYAGRGALAALSFWVGAAAMTAAAAVVVHADALAAVERGIGGGAVGESGLFLVDLALVPNAVLWAGAVLTGPGFALGTGTSVTVFAVVRGPLPGLPLLAGTPEAQHPSTWWLLLLVLPLAAGACGTLVVARKVRPWPERIASAAVMAALGGLIVGVLEMYAGGPVAFGPMSVVGSTAWLVGVLTALEFALAAAAVLCVRYAWPLAAAARGRRGVRLVDGCEVVADDEEAEPEVEQVDVFVVPQRQDEPVVSQRQDEPVVGTEEGDAAAEADVAAQDDAVAETDAPVQADEPPASPPVEVAVELPEQATEPAEERVETAQVAEAAAAEDAAEAGSEEQDGVAGAET
jgi:hypothetical protein